MCTAALGLTACNNFQKGPGGLEYKIFKNAGNSKIDSTDFVMLNAVIKTQGDSLINSTYDNGQPIFFEVPAKHSYEGDIVDGIKLLGEGDSVEIRMNLDSIKKFNPQQQFKEGEKYVSYIVKVEKVIKKAKGVADSTFNKQKQEFYGAQMKAAMEKLEKSETAKIQDYIKTNNLKTSTTPEGLNYEIKSAGGQEMASNNDTVTVKYVGYLTTKNAKGEYKIFDTTDPIKGKESITHNAMKKYEPAKMVVGQVIPGFSKGLTMVGKGGKILLVIPSKLAYGPQGIPPIIAPYSPLIFDIEVLDIKKGKASTAPTGQIPPPPPIQKK